jgi:small multidrug resistance pump
MITKYYLTLIVAVCLAAAGQLALKAGSGRDGGILEQLVQRHTIAALAAYFLAVVNYMYALREIPVSVAFPSVSFGAMVIVAIMANLLWEEPFGVKQFFAIFLFGAGIFLMFRE